MRKLILLFTISLTLSCCNNDDGNNSQNPIDQLPPATQTGENTFGCLLDGEVFIPSGGNNPLDCVYQFVNGGYYFGLQGNKRDEDNNLITIALGTNNLEITEGVSYNLLENITGNAYGVYSFFQVNYTSQSHTGQITITKLDTENQIVSGTFFFDILDSQGNVRTVSDGRFDMQYTQ